MSQKSRSTKLDQASLITLQNRASEKIDELLDYFGLDLSKRNKFFVGPCPIHGGSNQSAFNIFHTGNDITGIAILGTKLYLVANG